MQALLSALLRIRKMGLVLFGHGVTNNRIDDYIELLHTDFEKVKETIEIFKGLGFEFISMAELIRLAQNNFKCDKNWVHLTFDDGYRNNYTLLYPYLKAKQIPFSLFISTNHIEKNERLDTYKIRCAILKTKKEINIPRLNQTLSSNASREERIQFCKNVTKIFKAMDKPSSREFVQHIEPLLSPKEWQEYNNLYCEGEMLNIDQLKELANDRLVHIGSHNHNHLILNQNVSDDDIHYEMQQSKNWLKEHLNVDIFTYCYPNGSKNDFTPKSKGICQSLGYELAFTTIRQSVSPDTDRLEIPRIAFPIGGRNITACLIKLALPNVIINLARYSKLHSIRSFFGLAKPFPLSK